MLPHKREKPLVSGNRIHANPPPFSLSSSTNRSNHRRVRPEQFIERSTDVSQKIISFHYTLTDPNGKTLDSSADGEPLTFLEGVGQIFGHER